MEFAGFKFVTTGLVPDGSAYVVPDEDMKRIAASIEARIEADFRKSFGLPPSPPRHNPPPPCGCRMVHICNLAMS